MNSLTNSQSTDYYETVFTNLVYRSEKIEDKEFYDCIFENCTFHEVNFSGSRFVNCTFKGCDFSLAQVPNTRFRGAKFEHAKMIGIDWSVVSSPLMAEFFDCDLSYSSFAHIDFTKGKIVRCKAHEVYFWETNLIQANLSETDFENSQFKECNLTKADFSTARNYAINPSFNILKKAKFSLPEAVSLLVHLDIILVE